MSNLGEIITTAVNEQLSSIPAQRLIEKLSLIKNRLESSKKRWFWELLQNASDYNDSVSIRLIVDTDKVEFSHNGNPFSLNDALNLISPDSNKREDELHKDNIGKFGTGLVSTHILSSSILVKGLCHVDEKEDTLYRFSLNLDRSSFVNKANLIEAMAQARKDFEDSLVQTDESSGFLTSFTYSLKTSLPGLPSIQAPDLDLEYLYSLLPYTLCFMPKIESVSILDERSNTQTKEYKICRNQSNNDHKISFEIKRDGNTTIQHFAIFKSNDVSSIFQYEDNRILPFPKGISKVFCGLPLIGTEDIGLPCLINSTKFEPTTEREGVELEPGSNDLNRKIMDDTIPLYKELLLYVEQNKMHNGFILTHIRRKYNGTQASNTQFYNRYINQYKTIILNSSIVVNAAGEFTPFSQIRLPFNDSKVDKELYNAALFVSKKILPQETDYESWFNATDFSLFTEQKYTYEYLAENIEKSENIYALGQNKETVVSWLKSALSYLKGRNKYIFADKKLLPNENGVFALSTQLAADHKLAPELKLIFDQLYEGKGRKIEDELLDPSLEDLDVVNKACKLNDLCRMIDDEIAEQYAKNQGNTSALTKPLNSLYSWISQCECSKDELSRWFSWYYPKRATLIVDMLTESEREEALVIAQSGKMKALAALASSDLTDEEIAQLVINIKKLPEALNLLLDTVDDKSYAGEDTGEWGEQIVYNDLLQKYPRSKGYKVIWASKELDEPRYDFEIQLNGEPICYYDAKTTVRGAANADSIPFFMRKSQWEFLQTLNDNKPYYIARVFKGDNGAIKYLQIQSKD